MINQQWLRENFRGAVAAPSILMLVAAGCNADDNDTFMPSALEVQTTTSTSDGIINGTRVQAGEFANVGALLMDELVGRDAKQVFCSSTLIAPDVVLTAAHCAALVLPEYGSFYFTNASDVSRFGPLAPMLPEPSSKIKSARIHPEYGSPATEIDIRETDLCRYSKNLYVKRACAIIPDCVDTLGLDDCIIEIQENKRSCAATDSACQAVDDQIDGAERRVAQLCDTTSPGAQGPGAPVDGTEATGSITGGTGNGGDPLPSYECYEASANLENDKNEMEYYLPVAYYSLLNRQPTHDVALLFWINPLPM